MKIFLVTTLILSVVLQVVLDRWVGEVPTAPEQEEIQAPAPALVRASVVTYRMSR